MDSVMKRVLLREEADSKARGSKAPIKAFVVIGSILGAIVTGAIIYVVFINHNSNDANRDQSDLSIPDLYLCSGDTENLANHKARFESPLERAKRQKANGNSNNLIKRVARPLSLPPHIPVELNFTYSPPLYHDVGARCAWGHLTNKRVPHLEEVGVAYDFQQLEARSCDDPEECKSLCLRMHKTDDPYLCNYFTWHRQKKLALFYFLEPTLKWNLTDDNRVETYFWQCREVQCAWYWRPHRVWSHLSELSAAQLRKAEGLIAVTQCADFPTCQFSCETRPSFRELGLAQKVPDNAKPEDPTCAYVVMPSKETKNKESFLFSKTQADLKNTTYRGSSFYDSFELICHEAETTTFFPPSASTSLPAQSSQVPAAVPPPPPPPASNSTNKRQKRDAKNELTLRECHVKNEQIDCSYLQRENKDHSQCIQLDSDTILKSAISLKIQSQRPLWLVLRRDGNEETTQLTPGLQHTVTAFDHRDGTENRCAPTHERHRHCSVTCNDRLALENCACTLTPTRTNQESIPSLLSVPLCDDEKLRSCVNAHLEQSSNVYFDCMKECKNECDARKLQLTNKASIVDQIPNDTIQMHLSYSSVHSTSMNAEKDTNEFVYWVPFLVIGILFGSFLLFYCARALM